MATNPDYAAEESRTILGHPRGLFVLFFAEMWERFSYYGMRALLIFYLVQHWMYSDERASVIYGAYTALVYITPVLGGYLADRYLGQRKAVLFGAILLTFGHFLMAFEGDDTLGADNPAINIFWLALAFIIVGSGFLKANISVMVGQLYPRTDVRRDGAYTIFYMGINLGAALGAIIAGYLGQTYGWSYGFGAAGIGMLLGLIVFIWGKPLLMGRGESQVPEKLASTVAGVKFEWLLYGLGIAAVGGIWLLIQYQSLIGWLLALFGVVLFVSVIYYSMFVLAGGRWTLDSFVKVMTFAFGALMFVAFFLHASGSLLVPALLETTSREIAIGNFTMPIYGIAAAVGAFGILGIMIAQVMTVEGQDRDRIFAAMFLIFGSILFWALFEQAGSSLNLFTDRHVDRVMLGIDVPAAVFQSINAIYIVLLAPLFAMLWIGLGRRGLEPSAPAKFGLGMIQLGAGFLVLVAGAYAYGLGVPTPIIFIFLIYLLHTTGELCLSPVGLSAMNRLAPSHMASIIMGTWFFASATGNFVAGLIAAATGAEGLENEAAGKEIVLSVYSTVGWVAIGVGVGVFLISPIIKKLMHLDTLKDDDLAGTAELAEPAAPGMHPGTQPNVPGGGL
ncbi:MAG: peptide MFS transporter [Sphingomonas sp.]|nr:peptide MFS transporter [Sphingomonas sp.]